MTEKQKRIAIIATVIIIALWLFWPKAKKVLTDNGWIMPDIIIPAFDLPPRTEYPIVIPGLPPLDPIEYPFSAVSACGCGTGLIPYYLEPAVAQTPTQPTINQPVVTRSSSFGYRTPTTYQPGFNTYFGQVIWTGAI